MSLAPIALFAYNRLDHLRQTVASLAANSLASRSDLRIYSDAPKFAAHEAGVRAVRNYLKTVTGFGSVTVVEQSSNKGLAASIIDGVTELCREADRVIVLEDDLVVAPAFLEFMNGALERYRDADQVMQVSGYMFPVRHPERLPEIFFTRLPNSWGWATWGRAWSAFDPDAGSLLARIEGDGRGSEFDIGGSYAYLDMLRLQTSGQVDSWAVRWYASMFVAEGLCVRPARSLVQNAGFDGTGIHCDETPSFDVALSDGRAGQWPDKIEECPEAIAALAQFFLSLRPTPLQRARSRLQRWLTRATNAGPLA
jgi:Glycosyl transferase family 2